MNQEPINPDYGYIMNQQVQTTPPKHGPKFVLLISTVLVGVVCLGLLMFVKVQPEKVSQTEAKTGRQVSDQYISLMAKGELSEELINTQTSPLTNDKSFQKASLKRLQQGIQFSTCVFTETIQVDKSSSQHIYTCQLPNEGKASLVLTTNDNPPGSKIIAQQVKASA